MAVFEVGFIENNAMFDLSVDDKSSLKFKAEMGEIQRVVDGAKPYDGEYVVTPKVEAQTLETKDKVLRENVEILKIPFFSTSNNSGGNTVYIGSEL